VPGHRGIEKNKTADHFVRIGPECPFIGPELACVISEGDEGLDEREHENSVTPYMNVNILWGFLQASSVRNTRELQYYDQMGMI
jgi:hypothetical protein